MGQTVWLDDELARRCQLEADRAHGGDLNAAVAAGMTYYLGLRDQEQVLAQQTPAMEGEPEEARLARAVAASGISTSTLQSIAVTLARVAGGVAGIEPGPPYAHVRAFLDWAQAAPLSRQVGCVLVSTQPASGQWGGQWNAVVGFARGFLQASNGTLGGELQEYFSDRTAGPGAAPFDATRVDRVGVNVATDELMGLVTVELIAHSWDDSRQVLQNLRLQEGVLVGVGASVGNQTPSALYALSLATVVVPG